MGRISFPSQLVHAGSNFFPPMFWAHNQEAKTLSLPLEALPVFIRLGVPVLLHCKARISKFFAVDQVNIGAVTSILEFLGLSLDVFDEVVVEIRGAAELEFFDFGSKEFGDFVLGFLEIVGGGGLEDDSLL